MRFVRVDDVLTQIPDWIKGPFFPDPSVGVSNSIGSAIGTWIAAQGQALITLLNANSPEIITLGIVICAAGMMVAPLIGGNTSKWTGKLFGVLWGGVVWRVLIA